MAGLGGWNGFLASKKNERPPGEAALGLGHAGLQEPSI